MSESDEYFIPHSDVNYSKANITSNTIRNNLRRQQYNMRGFDQRSMYSRREASPISLRSFPNSGTHNYRSSYHPRRISSQRSVFNGRSGSPMSMRTIDSNASVSAVDIAFAFKNNYFNKYDLSIIEAAYSKYLKNRVKKRFERKRNLKLFLKGNRRRSDDQDNDSSTSSDGCRSNRTTHKENLPISKTVRPDLSNFRKNIKESDMFKDCTENIKQNSLKNMLAVNNTISHNDISDNKLPNTSSFLKDRFAKGASFHLPSQRFNKSLAKAPSHQTLQSFQLNNVNNKSYMDKSDNRKEILSERTVSENIQDKSTQHKPSESKEINSLVKKRKKKLLSPIKPNNDFNFKMPQMPANKLSNFNSDPAADKIIAQSCQPVTRTLAIPINTKTLAEPPILEGKQLLCTKTTDILQNGKGINDSSNPKDITNNSDVSMRPSFIKRKLFSQKLDMLEKQNISSDNLGVNSPQAKIYSGCGEKNKVRKLVTSQSCLSRDVLGDNNVLDLIHKIVPPDQMNITSATNRREPNKSNRDSNDKWDTSVLSTCNDHGRDTFTDDEIFKAPIIIHKTMHTKEVNKLTEEPVKIIEIANKSDSTKNKIQCKVVLQTLLPEVINTLTNKFDANKTKCPNKKSVTDCVRTFWDTDFESDMEEGTNTPRNSDHHADLANDVLKNITGNSSNINICSKGNVSKGNFFNVTNIQNRGISSSKSNISRVSKLKGPLAKDITNQETKTDSAIDKHKNVTKPQLINNSIVNKQDKQKSKANKGMKISEKNNKNEKIKYNSVNTKEKNISDKNTSRESVQLKEKRKKANLSITDTTKQNLVPPPKTLENIQARNTNEINSKSKEYTNKDTKAGKNHSIKNAMVKNTRQSPRKCNRSQLTTPMNQSVSNISNISSRSLRVRKIQSPRKFNIIQLASPMDQSSINITNISNRSLRVRKRQSSLKCNRSQLTTLMEQSNLNISNMSNRSLRVRKRQSPLKCNRSQLTTSMDQSNLNISNISNRSLRVRRKAVK